MVNRRTIIWLAHIWVPICSWWIWRTFRIKHANDCLLLNICSILHWADTTYVLKTELFFHPHRLHFWRNNKNIYWGLGIIHIKTIVTVFLCMNVVCTYKKWKKKFDHFQKKRFCSLIVHYHLFFKTGLLIFQIQFRSNKMFYLINWESALTPSRTTALPPIAPWVHLESKRAN